LKSKYDVVVIGAGLGGLTTASLLAKSGLDVLVIEQHNLPGGACTSFRREGHTFDAEAALVFRCEGSAHQASS
jgi:prolycopene isomerase